MMAVLEFRFTQKKVCEELSNDHLCTGCVQSILGFLKAKEKKLFPSISPMLKYIL